MIIVPDHILFRLIGSRKTDKYHSILKIIHFKPRIIGIATITVQCLIIWNGSDAARWAIEIQVPYIAA